MTTPKLVEICKYADNRVQTVTIGVLHVYPIPDSFGIVEIAVNYDHEQLMYRNRFKIDDYVDFIEHHLENKFHVKTSEDMHFYEIYVLIQNYIKEYGLDFVSAEEYANYNYLRINSDFEMVSNLSRLIDIIPTEV